MLNLIVNQYLDFAELQAKRRRQMTMKDWTVKLDDFLRLNDMEILEGLGKLSKKQADDMAHLEFKEYKKQQRRIEDHSAADALEKEAQKLINAPADKKKTKAKK